MPQHKCDFKLCHKHSTFVDEVLKCCVMVFLFSAIVLSMHLTNIISMGGLRSGEQVLGSSTSR